MNLPIPKTRSGILTAVLLALTLLGMYYTRIVSDLFSNQYVGELLYTDNLSVDQTNQQCDGIPIEIIAKVPKSTSQIIPGYIYLRVKNKRSSPISVSISVTREEGDVIPLPGVYGENILPNKVSLDDLAPEEEAYMRFFLSLKSLNKLIIHVTQDNGKHYACKLICPEQQDGCVSNSVSGALKRNTIEHILLPPWSNVVIPILAFTLIYLLEEEDENKGVKETILLFILGFLESVLFYGAVKAWLMDNWSVVLWFGVFILILIVPKKQKLENFSQTLGSLIRGAKKKILQLPYKRER